MATKPTVNAEVEESKKVESKDTVVDQQKNYDAQLKSTKAALDAEPKVLFMVPLSPGEKEGADDIAIVNGYSYRIKKNCQVSIPQSIANLLANKYKIEMTAGSEHRVEVSEKRMDALT